MDIVYTQWEFVKNISKLLTFIEGSNFMVTLGEAYRPYELHLLYLHGLSVEEYGDSLNFVPTKQKARTKTSKHLKRLAIDFNFFIKNDNGEYDLTYDTYLLTLIGEYWETLNENNVWGGFWKHPDPTHFQMSY
jgi:hypothetical protein